MHRLGVRSPEHFPQDHFFARGSKSPRRLKDIWSTRFNQFPKQEGGRESPPGVIVLRDDIPCWENVLR